MPSGRGRHWAWIFTCVGPTQRPSKIFHNPPIAAAAVFCCAWWTIHQLIAEASDLYSIELSAISAVISAATFALAFGLLALTQQRGIRALGIAALLGALGMLLYDQINMAVVTGPVAMLFWMLLGLADSHDPAPLPRNSRTAPGCLKGGSSRL